MRAPVVLVGLLTVLAGCNDPEDPTIAAYQVYFQAFGGDTTPQRARTYDCVVTGHFTVPLPLEPSGTVLLDLLIARSLSDQSGNHQELTRADTMVSQAELAYDGLGEDNLSFSLTAGSYNLTPPAGARIPSTAEYGGDWTCGPDLPLAQDSTLMFYGYDPNIQIPGLWRISENLPFE